MKITSSQIYLGQGFRLAGGLFAKFPNWGTLPHKGTRAPYPYICAGSLNYSDQLTCKPECLEIIVPLFVLLGYGAGQLWRKLLYTGRVRRGESPLCIFLCVGTLLGGNPLSRPH